MSDTPFTRLLFGHGSAQTAAPPRPRSPAPAPRPTPAPARPAPAAPPQTAEPKDARDATAQLAKLGLTVERFPFIQKYRSRWGYCELCSAFGHSYENCPDAVAVAESARPAPRGTRRR